MAKLKVITILSLNGIVFGTYTNNLAAFNHMKKLMLSSTGDHIPSYSTINRAVVNSGDSLSVHSLLGSFIVKKYSLLRTSI